MCEGSIHVAHRNANESEDLVVRAIPNHGMSGYYPADPKASDQRLVCIRDVQSAVLDKIAFKPKLLVHIRNSPMAKLQGMVNVKAQLRHQHYQDEVIVGTVAIPLQFLVDGVRVRIPPTVVGVDAVKAALVEQEKTSPVRRALSMTANAIRKRAARAKAKAEA